jgi:general secretion pathway protein D
MPIRFQSFRMQIQMRAVTLTGLVLGAALLAGCADTRIRSQADEAMARGDYESALRSYQDGLQRYPDSTPLRSGWLRSRQEVLGNLLAEHQKRRDANDLEGARAALTRAISLDPESPRLRALQGELAVLERQGSALALAQEQVQAQRPDLAMHSITQALKDNPRHAALLNLRRQIEAGLRAQEQQATREVLSQSKPISLDFRDASLRTVLDLVSRHSGVNYVVDRDVRSELRVTLLLQDSGVEEALDLLLSTNQLAKKVVDARTIVIYPNTPEKAKEYQEQVVRVFYLNSGEARSAAAFLRAMLRVSEPFVEERTNMLALRDSAENIRLAERLIGLYDAGEPEVLLELEVLEVNTRRLSELGVKLPDSISLTALPPAGQSGLTLDNIAGLGRSRIALGIGGVLINLKREAGDFSTLANPRIRVKNREKAKVLVGDKVPVISTVTGQTGFVSDSITYLDVGLKLEVEPAIYADDEVGIKVALEVSSLGTAVRTAAGALAYQIGTRNASTWLRLRDGETQLLAGLISRDERTSANRVPGAGDLPVLGRLFSSTVDNAQRTELVLAVTPRVLRNVQKPTASESEVWIGTEARPGLRSPRGAKLAPKTAAAGDTISADTKRLSPAKPLTSTPTAPAAAEPAPFTPMTLRWQGPDKIAKGQTVALELHADQASDLRALPMELGFDATQWAFVSVEEGDLLSQGQTETTLVPNGSPESGAWGLSILRRPANGVDGPGRVLTLKLRALKAGNAAIAVRAARSVSSKADVVPLTALPVHQVTISD